MQDSRILGFKSNEMRARFTTMAHRYPLIFNPSARSQRGRRTLRFLMSHAQWFVLYASRSAEDATELAAKLAEDGEPVVVAAGGMAHSMPWFRVWQEPRRHWAFCPLGR